MKINSFSRHLSFSWITHSLPLPWIHQFRRQLLRRSIEHRTHLCKLKHPILRLREVPGLYRADLFLDCFGASHAWNWLCDLKWVSTSRFHWDLFAVEVWLEGLKVARDSTSWTDDGLVESFLLNFEDCVGLDFLWVNTMRLFVASRCLGCVKFFVCVKLIWIQLI